MMNISIIGTGYVGLVTGACFAEKGNEVICVDKDSDRINRLSRGEIPIYESGLEDIVLRNLRNGQLTFTTELDKAINKSSVSFITVGTPPAEDGSANLGAIYVAAKAIGRIMHQLSDTERRESNKCHHLSNSDRPISQIVVIKSTVPIGTADEVRQIIANETSQRFHVVSNPEFLREGAAVKDFINPHRVVIGTDNPQVADIMRELYLPFTGTGKTILTMDNRSAEMTKYAANAMLVTRISFMNEIANICEKVGANVNHVREGIGLDPRIGRDFLFPGVGYGGSCFPKDIRALISVAKKHECPTYILEAVEKVNELQKDVLISKIKNYFAHDLAGKTIAVWGLSFKPGTDDIRSAPSIAIIQRLLELGARVKAYDPKAAANAKAVLDGKVDCCEQSYDALTDADALVIITEWPEFQNPDFDLMGNLLRHKAIFDGRNIYDSQTLRRRGFTYFGIGT